MFRNFQSLFKAALSAPPDLIIMELEMNDDKNFSKSIETLTAEYHIPFLLLSSYTSEDIQGRVNIPGCTILSKPYNSDDLVKALVDILNLSISDLNRDSQQFPDFNN